MAEAEEPNGQQDEQLGSQAESEPILLVAGLGNPGEEYAGTRHNAGFRVADELARRHTASASGTPYWKSEAGCAVTTIELGSTEGGRAAEGSSAGSKREILLAKPLSFMNSSGGPLSKLAAAHGIKPEEILVIHDELDIPAGDVRAKFGGGHAGHNGLKSIVEKLNSRDFARIRVGIGRPPGSMDPADYVLRELKGEDAEDFEVAVMNAADAAECAIMDGISQARDKYNGLHRA